MSRLFAHFAFLRLDSQFRTLQSNEKLVARQQFLSVVDPIQRDAPLFCAYAVGGLSSDSDVLLWRAAGGLEALQDSFHRLMSHGMGRYLVPVRSHLAVPVGEMEPPKAPYLFVRASRRACGEDLSPPQRQELAAEESRVLSKHPSVKPHAFETFEPGQDFLMAYETKSPLDFMAFLRDLRSSKAGSWAGATSSTQAAVRKDIRDLVDAIG